MSKVEVKKKSLLINGRKVFLRAGEISYYRTPRDSWRERLENAKKCNLNCISTYVPWFWHEPNEGEFDFTGKTHPEKDLVTFLDLAQEIGLYVFIRPGPFINSEMRFGGHPEWLFRNYPEVWSHNAKGEKALWLGHGVPVPSQMHPKFLEMVDKWYAQVIPLVARYSIDNGGPIILSQPDNEMNMIFTYSLTQCLYDQHIIGDGEKSGMWQDWLLTKYGGLGALRARYAEGFRKESDIQPPREIASDPISRRKIADWLEFKEWYVFTYAEHLVKRFHHYGLTVPFTMNEPINFIFKGGDHAAASRFFKKYEGQYFTNGHLYLTGGEQDLIGLPITLYRLELVKMFYLEGPTVAGELGSGWCDLTRNRAHYNFDLLTRMVLGHGLDGYSFYMYSGGYNPPGSNNYGRDYHWNAPILPDGTLHPTYYRAQRMGQFIAGWEQEIADSVKEFDYYICLSTDLSWQARWMDQSDVLNPGSEDIFGHATLRTQPSQDAYDGVEQIIRILTPFNLHFQFLNLTYLPDRPVQDKPLIVPTSGRLASEAFDFLKERIAAGQSVIFFPVVPTMDLEGNLREDFLDFLDISGIRTNAVEVPGMQAYRTRFLTVDGTNVKEVAVDRGLYTFDKYGKADVLASYQGQTVSFHKKIGNSHVVVMGLYPSYLTHDSQQLFQSILADAIGVKPHVYSEDGNLHAVIRRRELEPAMMVTVSNNFGVESATRIVVDVADQKLSFPRVTRLEIEPKKIYQYWVNVNLGYATLKYATAELIPTKEDKTSFIARGDKLTEAEICFDKKVIVEVNGSPLQAQQFDDTYIYTFTHGKEDSVVDIRAN